jgi:DNA repair exonuclease SbcCD ATPase subunit
MSRLSDGHRQQLRFRDTQTDLGTMVTNGQQPEDFEGKLEAAKLQFESLQAEQRRLEQEKLELAELNERREEFLQGQVDISEKLSRGITAINNGLSEMRREMDDLEKARFSFAEQLEKIGRIEPLSWTKEGLKDELQKAISMISIAEDEYEQIIDYLNSKESGVLNQVPKGASFTHKSTFRAQFLSGLAFNLPLIILGAVALLYFAVNQR